MPAFPAILCAENITLLSLLTETPNGPRENPPPSTASTQTPTRLLSFKRESALASTVAFLSGISNDANHIVAACVEEVPGGSGMRVLVAINKETPRSGEKTLSKIKQGLEKVFDILSQADDAGAIRDIETRVFDAIVEMCQDRILARIGYPTSGPSSRKKRSFLGSRLGNVIEGSRSYFQKNLSTPTTRALVDKACGLLHLINEHDNIEKGQDLQTHLKGILTEIFRLVKAADISQIISDIPTRQLDPGIGKGTVRRLEKLARYRECSRSLVQSAKGLAMFRKIEVVTISLDAEIFARNYGPVESCLPNCLARSQAAGASADYEAILTKLKRRPSNPRDSFVRGVKKSLKESKIHAEVQLVAYYEMQHAVNQPRVICASKDACYLCNIFIQTHGKFYTPKTHGRLYSGWRLPNSPAFDAVQARLNKCLEVEIREYIAKIMGNGVPKISHPNESTLFWFSRSLSSLESLMLSVVSASPRSGIVERAESQAGQTSPDPGDGPPDALPRRTTLRLPSPNYRLNQSRLESIDEAQEPVEKRPGLDSGGERSTSTGKVPVLNSPILEVHYVEEEPHDTETTTAEELSTQDSSDSTPLFATETHASTPEEDPPAEPQDSPKELPGRKNSDEDQQDITPDEDPPAKPQEPPKELPPPENSDEKQQPEDTTTPSPSFPPPTAFSPPPNNDTLPSKPTLQVEPEGKIPLIRGQTTTLRLDTPPGIHPRCYSTGLVNIYPEFVHTRSARDQLSNNSSTNNTPPPPLMSDISSLPSMSDVSYVDGVEMRIRWLLLEECNTSTGKVGTLVRQKPTQITSLPIFEDVDGGSSECVYLAHGADVVKVEVVRGYAKRL